MRAATRPLAAATVDAVVIAVLVVLAAAAFGGAYGGTRWWVAAAGGALVGAGVAVLAARRRWPWWGTGLAVAAGYLLFGAALAVPASAIGGVLPGIESLRLLTVGVVSSWRQLLTVAVPVGTSGALMIPVYLTALVTAAVGTSIAVRARTARRAWWALVAPLTMLVVAALFGASSPWLPLLAGLGVALGGLAWASWRGRSAGGGLDLRRPVSALVVLAAAVVAGFVLGPQADVGPRFALREVVQPPFDPQQYPSPLAGFRKYFKDQRDADLFTITGLPAGARVRVAAMDDYDGVAYATSSALDPFRKVGDEISGQPPSSAARAATVQVSIEDYRGVFLPLGGSLTSLQFDPDGARSATLQDAFRYSPGNATGVVVGGLAAADGYRAQVLTTPMADQLDLSSTPIEPVTLPSPGKISDDIVAMAGRLTENATTPQEKIAAIRKGLADQGFLSHGTQGEEPSASGHGLDRLSALVGDQVMVGDQEQFAPTMALMLRAQGIPARVVMGFAPPTDDQGSPVLADGQTWTVRGGDATAWVEVPFQGVGWVAFDPTPDDQRIEQQPDPEPEVAPRAQVLQPPPPPQPPQEITTDEVNRSQNDQNDQDNQNDDASDSGAVVRTILLVTAWVGTALLVIGGPIALILWLKARRRRRRQEAAVVADRIAGGWDQIVDVATDLGYGAASGRTRTETAADLDATFGGSTVLLARRADARVFGPEELDDGQARQFWADVDAAVLGLSSGRSRWRRLRAALSLRSLRRSGRAGGRR